MNLIIFDIDGTLSQTNGIDTQCYVQAIEEVMETKLHNTDWDSYPNVTDEALAYFIFQELKNCDPTLKEVDCIKNRLAELLVFYSRKDPAAFREIPGAKAFFRKMLLQVDWAVAIATGSWKCSADAKLAAINFDRGNAPLATADMAATKPDILTEAINLAKELHGIDDFARIIYVGDRPYDFRSASLLGMEFLGVDVEGTGKLREAAAAWVVRDFEGGGDAIISAILGFGYSR